MTADVAKRFQLLKLKIYDFHKTIRMSFENFHIMILNALKIIKEILKCCLLVLVTYCIKLQNMIKNKKHCLATALTFLIIK